MIGTRDGVRVVRAIRDPSESPGLAAVIDALGGDVRAAYGLEPAPPAGERDVRAGAHSIEIDNHARRYRVVIETVGQEVDVPLDPALFKE